MGLLATDQANRSLKAIYMLRVFLLSDPVGYQQKYHINHVILPLWGRRDGVMVSALDSGSRGLGSKPGQVIVWCSWFVGRD